MRAAPEGAEAQGPCLFYRLGPADRPPRALQRDSRGSAVLTSPRAARGAAWPVGNPFRCFLSRGVREVPAETACNPEDSGFLFWALQPTDDSIAGRLQE